MGRIKRVSYMDEILRELIATSYLSDSVRQNRIFGKYIGIFLLRQITKSCGPILGALADIRRVLSLQIGQ